MAESKDMQSAVPDGMYETTQYVRIREGQAEELLVQRGVAMDGSLTGQTFFSSGLVIPTSAGAQLVSFRIDAPDLATAFDRLQATAKEVLEKLRKRASNKIIDPRMMPGRTIDARRPPGEG